MSTNVWKIKVNGRSNWLRKPEEAKTSVPKEDSVNRNYVKKEACFPYRTLESTKYYKTQEPYKRLATGEVRVYVKAVGHVEESWAPLWHPAFSSINFHPVSAPSPPILQKLGTREFQDQVQGFLGEWWAGCTQVAVMIGKALLALNEWESPILDIFSRMTLPHSEELPHVLKDFLISHTQAIGKEGMFKSM